MATNSRHSHLWQTCSRLSKGDRPSGPLISAEPAHNNRVRLHPKIVTQIFGAWGTPTMDMLATVHNMHLPQFMSPILDLKPRPLALDALSQDWQGRSMFFSPFPLLSKVIQKLGTTQEGEVILISHWWPSQPWFPHLLRLFVDHPLFFRYSRYLLSQ